MSKVVLGNVVIDRSRYEAWVGGCLLRLTFVEFELLWELARHAPSVISRRHLMRSVWRESPGSSSRKINIQICRLRQKMAGSDWIIETHSKRGYALAEGRPAGERVPRGALLMLPFLGGLPARLNDRQLLGHSLHMHRPSAAAVALASMLLSAVLLLAIRRTPALSRRVASMAWSLAHLLPVGIAILEKGLSALRMFLLATPRSSNSAST